MNVAVIDDDPSGYDTTAVLVEGAGHTPVQIQGHLKSVPAALKQILAISDAAICDHRLQPRKLAKFYGAELVAALVENRKPALLVSQFMGPDGDVSIRRWREHLPVVLTRDEFDADRLSQGLKICVDEIEGRVRPERQTYRQLVRVEGRDTESGKDVADVIVPSWKPNEAVRIPIELFPKGLRRKVKPDARFFARVNVGAQKSDELFFKDFELAEDPDDDDGLK